MTLDPTSNGPKLALKLREAAKAIGVSERTLWSLTNSGDVPHVRIGRRVLYPVSALEAWLSQSAKGGTCEPRG